VPILCLSVLAAAFAYVAGITAARLLGAKVASFVGLTEVLFAVLFAWLLLDQLPSGAAAPRRRVHRRAGVTLVRLDEMTVRDAGRHAPPSLPDPRPGRRRSAEGGRVQRQP